MPSTTHFQQTRLAPLHLRFVIRTILLMYILLLNININAIALTMAITHSQQGVESRFSNVCYTYVNSLPITAHYSLGI